VIHDFLVCYIDLVLLQFFVIALVSFGFEFIFSAYPIQARKLLWKSVFKMTYFVSSQDVVQNLHSVNQKLFPACILHVFTLDRQQTGSILTAVTLHRIPELNPNIGSIVVTGIKNVLYV